ncbi:hypothetical protein L1049_014508 [Liquidambar formosana]|uniref:PGG domain-containing protein n=1 Tax=Liquidambar formosana TaxID=63359 RepID=A0AAP0S2F3_LIQFO
MEIEAESERARQREQEKRLCEASLSGCVDTLNARERRLYEASLSGCVDTLNALIQEDELILDRVSVTCFHDTPLHIAAMRGHLDFTRALLSRKPKLATELDSLGRSPLHLAAIEGYVDIVRALLHTSTPSGEDMCLVRDHDGRTPLCLAVMKGRVEVIKELIRERPESIRETVDHGDTILHLCVHHNQLEALKLLVESAGDEEFVNSKDENGNTILHVATILKREEILKYLLSETAFKKNANVLNGNGFTALDVLEQCPRDLKGTEVRVMLLQVGVSKTLQPPRPEPEKTENTTTRTSRRQQMVSKIETFLQIDPGWLEQAHGNFLMAATLTATVAFQAGINPPGGFWQDTKDNHMAGKSVLASVESDKLAIFFRYNSFSFGISLSIILLMISGLSFTKNKLYTYALSIAMGITVLLLATSYMSSLDMILPTSKGHNRNGMYTFFSSFWAVELLVVIQTFRFLRGKVAIIKKLKARRANRSENRV